MKPYQIDIVSLCSILKTDQVTGLRHDQIAVQLKIYGANIIQQQKKDSLFVIFLLQFIEPLTVILLIAASIIFCIGNVLDASIISGILVFNAMLGTMQEKRTGTILDELQSCVLKESVVIRQGVASVIAHKNIVVGDIILLAAGEVVPADARIISSSNLMVDEAMITGESVPVYKDATLLPDKDRAIADQTNILFAGTYIVSGTVRAMVYAVGMDTWQGRICKELESIKIDTPLQQELHRLAYFIFIFVLCMSVAFFIIGLMAGQPLIDLAVMLTALFICVVPEGLPVVMTVILVSAAHRMSKKNVLVKNLKSMEALGRVDVIVTDKTGTLTRNEMIVSKVFVNNRLLAVSGVGYFPQGEVEDEHDHIESLHAMAKACAFINSSTIDYHEKLGTFTIKGDPTQAAAFVFAQKIYKNSNEIYYKHSVEYTILFDSQVKYQAVFTKNDHQQTAYILGAPEVIFAASDNLDQQAVTALQKLLVQGYRVLAVAQKRYTTPQDRSLSSYQALVADGLQFLGLLAIVDEPRENLCMVMQQAQAAGIQVIMATGDHKETALYVGKKVGIVDSSTYCMTGQEFGTMSNEQAAVVLRKNFICARFSPQDKLRLVQILHEQQKIVATTGDGINDIPALMASDISIAMGGTGTDLVKKYADIILLQDSFENIISIMQEGRNIFYTLRRTVVYFLMSNAGEVLIVFFALVARLPLPLLPAQILWLNLIADGFLDASLAMEPSDSASLLKTKKNIPTSIFDLGLIVKMLYLALPMSVCGMMVFLQYYQTDIILARTVTLVTLTMFQWFNALNCRHENKSVFRIGLFSNRWFVYASLAIMVLQYMVVYTPFMQYLFTTVPLSLSHWIYAVIVASLVFFIEEGRKFFVQKFFR